MRIFLYVLGAMILMGGAGCEKSADKNIEAVEAVYQCPMHPRIVDKKPGNCPICHMALAKVTRDPTAAKESSRKIIFYRHPMRPDVTSPAPAKDEMGMDYIPVYEDEAGPSATLEGRGTALLSPEKRRLIGVSTETVRAREMAMTLRTAGRVADDPELYALLSEYQEIRRVSSSGESPETMSAVHKGALLKLRRLGISENQIKDFDPPSDLILPKTKTWIEARVFESERLRIKPGLRAEVLSAAAPGRRFSAVVAGVEPAADETTRSYKARLWTSPSEALRPDGFVDVIFNIPLGRRLCVPTEAVLDSGESKIVFVDEGEGRLSPRSVRTGEEGGGRIEILSGVKEGENIVSSAGFLLDSESRFRSALENFSKDNGK